MATELVKFEQEDVALSWPDQAEAIEIIDQLSYDDAAGKLIVIALLSKKVVEHHQEPKKTTYAAWKSVCDAENKLLNPLKEAKTVIGRKIGAWDMEQERLRKAEEQRIREEARKSEEEERIRLAAEAEENGATEETVEEIVDTPAPVTREAAKPIYQKRSGIAVGKKPKWRWEIVDKNLIPRDYLKIDEVAINGVVKALGQAAQKTIPGIRVYADTPTVSVRAPRKTA